MQLHRLIVENFKSFATRQEADLGKITLIYGPNSTGKSTLLQSILLLKQTFAQTDPEGPELVVQGPLVNLNSFRSMIHGHEIDRRLRVGLGFFGRYHGKHDTAPWWRPQVEIATPVTTEFGFRWLADKNRIWQDYFALSIDDESLHCVMKRRPELHDLAEHGESADLFEYDGATLSNSSLFPWLFQQATRRSSQEDLDELSDNVSGGSDDPYFFVQDHFPGSLEWYFNDGDFLHEGSSDAKDGILGEIWRERIGPIERGLKASLESIVYLGPIRQPLSRYQVLSGAQRSSVGVAGEYTIELLGQDEALRGRVNRWFRRLQVPYLLQVRRHSDDTLGDFFSLALQDHRSHVFVSPTEVGFGISQLLPIVLQCQVGRDSIICIEQPELHLHPRLQAELADLFIESIGEQTRNQILLETHSESVMRRLQRRIREGRLDNNDVVVLYVDPQPDGSATVQRLRLDRLGLFIDEWPNGFFEERLNETLLGFDN